MGGLLYTHRAADPASLESTEDDVHKALQTGAYALTYNWEGVLPGANDPTKSPAAPHIRVALLPGGEGAKSASVSGAEGWAILAHSKRKAEAWKLLEYMATLAWRKKAAIITGNYPIFTSLYNDQTLQQTIQDFPIYGEQFRYLVTRPQLVSYARTSDILQTYLHRLCSEKSTPRTPWMRPSTRSTRPRPRRKEGFCAPRCHDSPREALQWPHAFGLASFPNGPWALPCWHQ